MAVREIVCKAIARPEGSESGTDIEVLWTTPSFVRAFGPGVVAVASGAWRTIPLDPAVTPWRQFGEECFEYSGSGLSCLKEGLYSVGGGVVFDSSNQNGDRAMQVAEVSGEYAGEWGLAISQPMPKVADAGLLVSGEMYLTVGDEIELQAQTSANTQTDASPVRCWLSAMLIRQAKSD